MTREEFDHIVSTYGEDRIFGIIFDNTARMVFRKREGGFTLDNNLITGTDLLKQEMFSMMPKKKITVIKSINDIQGIIIVDSADDTDIIDERYAIG
jgi:hypothetical protein